MKGIRINFAAYFSSFCVIWNLWNLHSLCKTTRERLRKAAKGCIFTPIYFTLVSLFVFKKSLGNIPNPRRPLFARFLFLIMTYFEENLVNCLKINWIKRNVSCSRFFSSIKILFKFFHFGVGKWHLYTTEPNFRSNQ